MFKTTSSCGGANAATITTSASGYYYLTESKPEAFITLNKNRQKLYKESASPNQSKASIYLPNQSQFEIELFNPTQDKVMAVITFNGKYTNKGVILKPGERFFLDRHLDEQKKLLFDVYEVNSGNEAVKKAIEKNGLVKIEFYKERIEPTYLNDWWCNSQIYNYTLNRSSSNQLLDNCNYSTSCNYSSSPSLNINTSLNFAPEEKSRGISNKSLSRKESLSKNLEETGRVDKGGMSEQKFKNTDFNAEYSPYIIFEYKLLPISQKPLTSKEINSQKSFCFNCGKKVEKKFKFCPYCSTKL